MTTAKTRNPIIIRTKEQAIMEIPKATIDLLQFSKSILGLINRSLKAKTNKAENAALKTKNKVKEHPPNS